MIAILLWLTVGYASFTHWWTKSYDFTVKDIPLAVLCSTMGPIVLVVGYIIHNEDAVIIKKGAYDE
jgi:bifunctional pyridoxal-dependent enzyme with beta-cystathionase and maltose regulon repressor activities